MKVIDDSERPLSPIEIAEALEENHSTVRVYCRRLLAKGKVVQPYPSYYCNKITYGVMFNPLMVHNIRLRFSVGSSLEHWEKTEVVGGVKVHVCFGAERRKVSGFIACDAGMSKASCLLALNRWFDLVEDHLGRGVENVEVQTVEFNKDYHGLRLDGVTCMTRKGLFGTLERLYQKEENVVRHEHKISKSMTVYEFESLLHGGVTGYNANQLNFALMQKVDQLTEALKFTNSQVLRLTKLQEAMFNRITREEG